MSVERTENARVSSRGKAQRRAAIERAALDLFAEFGYDQTTADAIAARAGVSRRTFFYYFPSKADVLFLVTDDQAQRIVDAVAAQPIGLDHLTAIEQALLGDEESGLESTLSTPRVRIIQVMQAAASSTTLRGKEYEAHIACEKALARGLASRAGLRGPDYSMRVAAAIGLGVLNVAMVEWAKRGDRDRATVISDAFAAARTFWSG